MATIDEANIATTILMLKVASEMKGRLPLKVDLALPEARPGVWRELALEYLGRCEAQKERAETLQINSHEASALS